MTQKKATMKRIVIAVILAVAAIAIAAPDVEPWRKVYERRQHAVPQKFELEVQASFIDAGSIAVNGLSFTPRGRGKLVYDFPSIPATGAGSACQDSAAGTATGCAFGDGVLLGIDQTLPANRNASPPVAYISAANTFAIRVCNDSTDGGAIDWPDASYTVTCIR
jgi:hypothetical protein